MVSTLRRLFQHGTIGRFHLGRALPQEQRIKVAAAVAALELRSSAEVRVVIEGALGPLCVIRGVSARQRAIELFSVERIWDTANNNGVLLYVLLAERDAEIVVDRGLNGKVSDAEWAEVARCLEQRVPSEGLGPALIVAIEQTSVLLQRAYPSHDGQRELSDDVIVR
jgi:uncharacterized membrane protein